MTTRIDKNRVKRSAPEAGFQAINGCAAQHWGQFPTFEGKTDSHGRSFTIWHKLLVNDLKVRQNRPQR
ncbi:MAG TPA: hypothetical protein VIY29_26710, partial [Ktedonobacteraceae bacterium]